MASGLVTVDDAAAADELAVTAAADEVVVVESARTDCTETVLPLELTSICRTTDMV